jgi:maleate isomerase
MSHGSTGSDAAPIRLGLIVPSSNTTMETELPRMLRDREGIQPERFTFHSSRMRMRNVNRAELQQMDAASARCATELADARVNAVAYACLVAIMSMGHGYHRDSERRLAAAVEAEGSHAPVITSAGALVQGIKALGVDSVSILMPYERPLADLVVSYVQHEGIRVIDHVALEISDNVAVGRRDPLALLHDLRGLNVSGAGAVVLSACVQMPSLAAIQPAEDLLGLPVLSAATATVRRVLDSLGLRPVVPNAGALLA